MSSFILGLVNTKIKEKMRIHITDKALPNKCKTLLTLLIILPICILFETGFEPVLWN